jgi:mono/diheme cytochrome c family protein
MAKKQRIASDINFNDGSKGWKLFQQNCAECHGPNGQGSVAVKMVSGGPYIRIKTEPLLGSKGYWTESKEKFNKLITEGLSGDLMPGNGTLTKSQLNDLYEFIVETSEKSE